jgi:hypothetical protein
VNSIEDAIVYTFYFFGYIRLLVDILIATL